MNRIVKIQPITKEQKDHLIICTFCQEIVRENQGQHLRERHNKIAENPRDWFHRDDVIPL